MTENNNHADRNLAMELVRATEAAAIASGPWVGAGDKNRADGAAAHAPAKGFQRGADPRFNAAHSGNGRDYMSQFGC